MSALNSGGAGSIKDDRKYAWTFHSKMKMAHYGIGPGTVKRVIRYPDRKEEGIAERTIAVMKEKKTKSAQELWVMYQNLGAKKRVISAWIYPGKSPKGKEIFVPDEVWIEIEKYAESKGKENL